MQPPPAERNPSDSAGNRKSSLYWTLATVWVALVLLGYLVLTVLGSGTVQRLLSR